MDRLLSDDNQKLNEEARSLTGDDWLIMHEKDNDSPCSRFPRIYRRLYWFDYPMIVRTIHNGLNVSVLDAWNRYAEIVSKMFDRTMAIGMWNKEKG